MFELGWTELLLVGVLGIIVLRPKDLPDAMRGMGRWAAKIKVMVLDLQEHFNQVVREAELDDVKKAIDEVRDLRSLSPTSQLKDAIMRPLPKVEAVATSNVSEPLSLAPVLQDDMPQAGHEDAAQKSAQQIKP